jgi:tetratricopeptide (TPR) repeat protein
MSERLRPESSHAPDGLAPSGREVRIEELLLAGLDDYFAGEYERAISAWTRVLFIDRGHARAKAYIDRARSAVAERQRESEELLHRGVAAFNKGESENARRLLTSAVELGGPQEVALAFLERLARLERPGQPAETAAGPRRRRLRRPRLAAPAGERRRTAWALPLVVLAGIVLAALYVQDSRERAAPFLFLTDREAGAPAASRLAEESLAVPRSAEVDLARARALLAAGHPRDALRLAERVRPADPLRAEADALREGIQRGLLTGSLAPGAGLPPPVSAARDQ